MIVVGIEPSHSPVFNRRDGRAVSRAKRAIAADEFLGRQRFVGIQHNQYFVTGQTRHGCTRSSRSNRSRPRTGRGSSSSRRDFGIAFWILIVQSNYGRLGFPINPEPKPASWAAHAPATRPLNMDGPSMVPSSPALPLMWPPAMPATSPAAYNPGIGSKYLFNTRQRRSVLTPPKFLRARGNNCTA